MQELEKILEEIKQEKLKHWDSSERLETDKLIGWCFDKCADIIRKYMGEGWIPVKERVPEDGEEVLCSDGTNVFLVEYEEDWDSAFGDLDGIIAWMPLPEPYLEDEVEKDEKNV